MAISTVSTVSDRAATSARFECDRLHAQGKHENFMTVYRRHLEKLQPTPKVAQYQKESNLSNSERAAIAARAECERLNAIGKSEPFMDVYARHLKAMPAEKVVRYQKPPQPAPPSASERASVLAREDCECALAVGGKADFVSSYKQHLRRLQN